MAARPRQGEPVFPRSVPAPQGGGLFAREEAEQSKRQDSGERHSFEGRVHRCETLFADQRRDYETTAFRFYVYAICFAVVPVEQRQQNAALVASNPRPARRFGRVQRLCSAPDANLGGTRNRTTPELVAIHSG